MLHDGRRPALRVMLVALAVAIAGACDAFTGVISDPVETTTSTSGAGLVPELPPPAVAAGGSNSAADESASSASAMSGSGGAATTGGGGADAYCGDTVCDGIETCNTCAADCGACPTVCGANGCK